jgi:hypothetical protein
LLDWRSVGGLTAGIEAQAAILIDQMQLPSGDLVESPLLSAAAVAGLLYDGVPLVVRLI